MVGVAQLVEHWVVVPGVAGSIPVTHPGQVARTIVRSSGPLPFRGPDGPDMTSRLGGRMDAVLTFSPLAGQTPCWRR